MTSSIPQVPVTGSLTRRRGISEPSDHTLVAMRFGALHGWNRHIHEAFAHADEPDALHYLASALVHLVSVESVMISLEYNDRPPQLLYQHGISEKYRESIIDRYFSGGYLLDPFCLAVEHGLIEGFYHLEEIAPDDFFDSEYYKTYYLKSGSYEDSFYIVDIAGGSKISVSLFQGFGGESLRTEQLNLLRAAEPLVREFIREFSRRGLHRSYEIQIDNKPEVQGDLKQEFQAAFESFGCDVLTPRERETAHMLLRGHSVKSTANQLCISPETVRAHRKSLYSKLMINSQSEMFAMFFEWLRKH